MDLFRFGMMLADMGTEVIWVEPPEGLGERKWGTLRPHGETLTYKNSKKLSEWNQEI